VQTLQKPGEFIAGPNSTKPVSSFGTDIELIHLWYCVLSKYLLRSSTAGQKRVTLTPRPPPPPPPHQRTRPFHVRKVVPQLFFQWRNSPQWARASSLSRLHDHTQDTPQSIGLLWTIDQPVAETSTGKHTKLTREREPWPRRYSNPQSQQNERPQAHALDRAASTVSYIHFEGIRDDADDSFRKHTVGPTADGQNKRLYCC
jgi:hypothetical protein